MGRTHMPALTTPTPYPRADATNLRLCRVRRLTLQMRRSLTNRGGLSRRREQVMDAARNGDNPEVTIVGGYANPMAAERGTDLTRIPVTIDTIKFLLVCMANAGVRPITYHFTHRPTNSLPRVGRSASYRRTFGFSSLPSTSASTRSRRLLWRTRPC